MVTLGFVGRIWANVKKAIMQHPIEILITTIFAVPFWFMNLDNRLAEHFAYWIFTPVFLIVIYLSRQTKWYKFSWLIPALSCLVLWYFNDNAEIYLDSPKFWGLNWIMVILLCSVPFQRENQPYMYHKFSTALNALFAFLTGLLIIAIIFAVKTSIEILFNLHFSHEIDERIALFSSYFFMPLFFLTYQQRQSTTNTANRWIDILLNFVASPALILFTAILYTYVGKILLAGELPKGMVANIVLPYVIAGLAIYCLRIISEKPRWEHFFHYYPYLALIPFVLLWFGIKSRIETYSWTEERLYLVALSTALSICYLTIILPKYRQYRYLAWIVMTGIFTMTFVLDPQKIAYNAQTVRFEQTLEKLGLLQNGKIRADLDIKSSLKAIPEAQIKDWQEINELAYYLYKHDQHPNKDDLFISKYGSQFMSLKHIGIHSDGTIFIDGEYINEMPSYMSYQSDDVIEISPEKVKRIVRWDEFRNNVDNSKPYNAKPFCLELGENEKKEQLGCWDFDVFTQEVFKKHHLDPNVKQTREALKALRSDLLYFRDEQSGNEFYFGRVVIKFHEKQGYVIDAIYDIIVLIK